MKSKIVGQLRPDEFDPDFFESDPYEIPYFDNQKLKVLFVEPRNKKYLEGADEVLQSFLEKTSKDRISDSDLVIKYYKESLKLAKSDKLDISTSEDIWKFVSPNEVILEIDVKGHYYLIVSCGCEWDFEEGLQLVFKNGQTLISALGHNIAYIS